MSNKEDQCFQCQEWGHIAHYCPNVCCFECDEYGHIVAVCPDRIPPSGTPAGYHRQNPNTRSTSRCHHQDKCRHSRSRLQSQPHRYRSHSCHNSHRGHSSHIIEIVDATIEAFHAAATVLITFATTHHIKDHHLHVEVPQLIPEITADPDHVLHINQVRKLCINLHPVLKEPQDRKHHRVTIDDPQTDYYSTADTSSDSKDDEGHLN